MKPIYSFVLLLPVLLLFSCSSTEKKTEDALSDSIPRTGNALNVDATKIISTEEPPEVFTTTTIENNDWLKEFIHDPFSGITLDSMPVLLESKSITAEFNNAENGNLLFDRLIQPLFLYPLIFSYPLYQIKEQF